MSYNDNDNDNNNNNNKDVPSKILSDKNIEHRDR
jgi:hypothetical protein